MPRSKSINCDRVGINAVEKVVLEWGWFFREQPVSDWGIDAQVEQVQDKLPAGRLIALQIKTGASYLRKREGGWAFYGKPRHLNYWIQHSLPVYVVVHIPERGVTYWQKVDRDFIEERERSWTLFIPEENILGPETRERFLDGVSDERSYRRISLAIDYPIMLQVKAHEETYLRVEHWVNKSLNFRCAEFVFDDPDKNKTDIRVPRWLPRATLGEYMDFHFPWLDYEYTDSPDISGFEEIAVHNLQVHLSVIGKAYVELERFYAEGRITVEPPEPPEPSEDDMSEEEWQEYQFCRALERDWEEEAVTGGSDEVPF